MCFAMFAAGRYPKGQVRLGSLVLFLKNLGHTE